MLLWLLFLFCDYNKVRGKYFKNNKVISYGNEKVILIFKIVI